MGLIDDFGDKLLKDLESKAKAAAAGMVPSVIPDLSGCTLSNLFCDGSFTPPEELANDLRDSSKGTTDKHIPLALIQFLPREGVATCFHVESLRVHFSLSQGYCCKIRFHTDKAEGEVTLESEDVASQPALCTIHRHGFTRYIHGICTDLRAAPGTCTPDHGPSDIRSYLMTLSAPISMDAWKQPGFAYSRDATVREVVDEQLLAGFDMQGRVTYSHRWDLTRPLIEKPSWFRFAATKEDELLRRCGQHGIWFAFEHALGELKLVLRDTNPQVSSKPSPLLELERHRPEMPAGETSMPVGTVALVTYDPEEMDNSGDGTALQVGMASNFEAICTGTTKNLPACQVVALTPDNGLLSSTYPDDGRTLVSVIPAQQACGVGATSQAEVDALAKLQFELMAVEQKRYRCKVTSIGLEPGHIICFSEASQIDEVDEPIIGRHFLVTDVELTYRGPGPNFDEVETVSDPDDAPNSSKAEGNTDQDSATNGTELWCTMIPLDTTEYRAKWPAVQPPGAVPCRVYAPANGEPHYDDLGRVQVCLPYYSESNGALQPISCWVPKAETCQFAHFPATGAKTDQQGGTFGILHFTDPDNCFLASTLSSDKVPTPFLSDPDHPYITGIQTSQAIHTIALNDKTREARLALGDRAIHSSQDLWKTTSTHVDTHGGNKITLTAPEIRLSARSIVLDAPNIRLTGRTRVQKKLSAPSISLGGGGGGGGGGLSVDSDGVRGWGRRVDFAGGRVTVNSASAPRVSYPGWVTSGGGPGFGRGYGGYGNMPWLGGGPDAGYGFDRDSAASTGFRGRKSNRHDAHRTRAGGIKRVIAKETAQPSRNQNDAALAAASTMGAKSKIADSEGLIDGALAWAKDHQDELSIAGTVLSLAGGQLAPVGAAIGVASAAMTIAALDVEVPPVDDEAGSFPSDVSSEADAAFAAAQVNFEAGDALAALEAEAADAGMADYAEAALAQRAQLTQSVETTVTELTKVKDQLSPSQQGRLAALDAELATLRG